MLEAAKTWTGLSMAGAILIAGCSIVGDGDIALSDVPRDLAEASFADRLGAASEEIDGLGLNVVIGVARDGTGEVYRAFNDAVLPNVGPAETQVDLNSITKTVTAAVVLDAIEDGFLSLDSRLSDLMDNVPADKAAITVHHLLTHSAGFDEAIGDDAEIIDRAAYLERALSSGLLHPPGERYHYTNVGYSMLAAMVEMATDMSYEQRLQRMLKAAAVAPMGYGSVLDANRVLRSSTKDTIFEASWGGHPPSWHLIGNGGLIATPRAFLAFEKAYRQGDLVGTTLRKAALIPHIAENEQASSHYGYGLVVEDEPDLGRVFWHDGGNDVFSAEWARLEAHGTTLFVAGQYARDGYAQDGEALIAMDLLQAFLFKAPSKG